MPLNAETVVGVVGAGAMGTGIAQLAAAAGHRVVLADAAEGATRTAQGKIVQALARDVEKKRRTRDEADVILGRLDYQGEPLRDDYGAFARCGLVIEAVIEDRAVKQATFQRLERRVSRDAVLATDRKST